MAVEAVETTEVAEVTEVNEAAEVCKAWKITTEPSITDGVHRNENFVEIIPVFSTFLNFFEKKKI
jgi:hypothetical protein